MRPRLLPKKLPAFLTRLRKTERTAITSGSVVVRVTEESQTQVTSETTVQDVSHQPLSSPLTNFVDPSDTKAELSPLVKKYEMGSGEDRVNVRIYKEPPTVKL